MSWQFILWVISFVVFWGYAIGTIVARDVPVSWSATFYELDRKKKNKGYWLTAILWTTSVSMMPIVAIKHPLMLIPLALICMIGNSPAYNKTKRKLFLHMFGSIGSVATAILVFAFVYKLYIIASALLIAVVLLQYVFTKFKQRTTAVESLVILAGHIIVLLKDVL